MAESGGSVPFDPPSEGAGASSQINLPSPQPEAASPPVKSIAMKMDSRVSRRFTATVGAMSLEAPQEEVALHECYYDNGTRKRYSQTSPSTSSSNHWKP